MARLPARLALVAVIALAGWAVVRWPRLDRVETGRTPEYPALQPRDYAASEARVEAAVKAAVERLGWQVTGSGRGRGGSEVLAAARGGVLPLGHEVTVRARREGGRTRVTVVSRSRSLGWDFGENARLVERFLAALDAEMASRR